MALTVSCQKQAEGVDPSPKIELRSSQDQFLKNFITVGNDGLTVSISCNDALFAGATATGYADLQKQVKRINSSFDRAARNHWEQTIAGSQMQTRSTALFDGIYDKYHVLESDKFLENFVYAENGEVLLEISEERAVLCGATHEGYLTVRGEVEDLNRMVQMGQVDFYEVQKCFDAKSLFKNMTFVLCGSFRPSPRPENQNLQTLNEDFTIQSLRRLRMDNNYLKE